MPAPIHFLQKGEWTIEEGLEISDFSREKMTATCNELKEEKETAVTFLA